jgi:hypothetical protein
MRADLSPYVDTFSNYMIYVVYKTHKRKGNGEDIKAQFPKGLADLCQLFPFSLF